MSQQPRTMSKTLAIELCSLQSMNPLSRERYEKTVKLSEAAACLLTGLPLSEEEPSDSGLLLTNLWRHCYYEPITYNKTRLLEKHTSPSSSSFSTPLATPLPLRRPSPSCYGQFPPSKKQRTLGAVQNESIVDVHDVIRAGIRTFHSIVTKLQVTWNINIPGLPHNEGTSTPPSSSSSSSSSAGDAATAMRDAVLADEIVGGGSGLQCALEICYKSLVYLGDLHRHWFMLDVVDNRLFSEARRCYMRARSLKPGDGHTFNQLGALESYVDNPLLTICFYAIGDASATPNKLSKANITGELSKFAKRKINAKTLSKPSERFVAVFLNLFSLLFKWTKKSPAPAPSKISRSVAETLSALEAVVIRLNGASRHSRSSSSSSNATFEPLAEAVALEAYLCEPTASRSPEQCAVARDLLHSTVSRIICSGVSFPPAAVAMEVAHIFLLWYLGSITSTTINTNTNTNTTTTTTNSNSNSNSNSCSPERDLWASAWDSVSNLLNCLIAKHDDIECYVDPNKVCCIEEALLCGAVPFSRAIAIATATAAAQKRGSSSRGEASLQCNSVLCEDSPALYALRKARLLELGRCVADLGLSPELQPLYWSETDGRFSHFCLQSQTSQSSQSLLYSQSQGSTPATQGALPTPPSQAMPGLLLYPRGSQTTSGALTLKKGVGLCSLSSTTSTSPPPSCCSQSLFIISSSSSSSSSSNNNNDNNSNSNVTLDNNDNSDSDDINKPFGWLVKEWKKK